MLLMSENTWFISKSKYLKIIRWSLTLKYSRKFHKLKFEYPNNSLGIIEKIGMSILDDSLCMNA